MTYKTSIKGTSFWYNESIKTVKLMLKGLSKTEINTLTSNENTYQVATRTRSKTISNTTYNRMSIYDNKLLEMFINADVTTSKIMVMISIIRTDRLFYEYMYDVYREHRLLGDKKLTRLEMDKFMEQKKIESEKISKWSTEVIKRLERAYFTFMRESGLLTEDNLINDIYIDYEVQKELEKEGFKEILDIIQ